MVNASRVGISSQMQVRTHKSITTFHPKAVTSRPSGLAFRSTNAAISNDCYCTDGRPKGPNSGKGGAFAASDLLANQIITGSTSSLADVSGLNAMKASDPLPTVRHKRITRNQHWSIKRASSNLDTNFSGDKDGKYNEKDLTEDGLTILSIILDKGALFHPRTRRLAMSAISTRLTLNVLSIGRATVARACFDILNLTFDQVLLLGEEGVALIADDETLMLALINSSSIKTNTIILKDARDCLNNMTMLAGSSLSPSFHFIGCRLCKEILATDNNKVKISCVGALSVLVTVADASYTDACEYGVPRKRSSQNLISKVVVKLAPNRAGNPEVMLAGRVLFHRLDAMGCDGIVSKVKNWDKTQLYESEKNNIIKAKVTAEKHWKVTGAKWLREKGHGHLLDN